MIFYVFLTDEDEYFIESSQLIEKFELNLPFLKYFSLNLALMYINEKWQIKTKFFGSVSENTSYTWLFWPDLVPYPR